MKSLDIIFLARSYYPNVGGVEKHLYGLTKSLAAAGHKITIITEDTLREQGVDFDYTLKNVEVIRIPKGADDWFKKFRIWNWIWSNRELLLKVDVVHCHDVFFWYLPLALIYPTKNVYTTFHGYESYPIKKKAILYRKVFEYMSNRTICVGDFMKKWYHAKPTTVIYGAAEKPTKVVKTKKNSAIFIGRLDEHTGIDVYVKAAELIRKKIPNFNLTVYGDGPYKKKCEKEGIILKGYDARAEEEVGKYEYAFVSRYLAILESMAAQRKIIAVYDNPVKEDYLKMAPFKDWITIARTPQEVANVVVADSKKENSIAQAFTWVNEQSWESLMHVHLKLWKFE